MEVLRDAWYVLERDVGKPYFRLRRTAAKLESLADMTRSLDHMEKALAKIGDAGLSILFDLRDAPMRTDPEFVRVARPYLLRLHNRFKRAAVLVKTQVGKLQTKQLASSLFKGNARVFDDEEAAIAYLEERE